jgi:hypothetical protein
MSDDIELNLITLEPEEDEEKMKENDDRYREEDCKSEHRGPMRKPAYLIQYWIDTGNAPHKILLDNGSSGTDLSLSEKEAVSRINSISTVLNDNLSDINSCNKCKSDSSCSSVDTAVYILSNANVTKKADAMAIVEGAKCTDQSLKECVKDASDKIVCIGTAKRDMLRNNNDDTDTSRNMSAKYMASRDTETRVQQSTDVVILSNEHASSQNSCCEETNRNDTSIASQKDLDVQNIDIASIFQQFDKTSKRLSQNFKTDSSQNEVSEKDINVKEIVDNKSLTNLKKKRILTNRKKLYTGRNSPVDLMLTKKHSMNKISEARKTLHPALEPALEVTEDTIKRKLSSVQAGKNKRLSGKSNSDFKINKNREKKKPSSISAKNIADINSINDNEIINNNVQNSDTINTSLKSLSNGDLDVRRNDVSPWDNNDKNISIKEKTSMPDLASLNLNPVVLLEPLIVFPFKRFDPIKTSHTIQNSDDKHLNISKKYICDFKNEDLEIIDSDESTILICKCKKTSEHIPALNQCILDSANKNDSTLDARAVDEKDNKTDDKKNKSSSFKGLKSADISRSKRAVVMLEQLSPSQYRSYKDRIHTTEESQKLNVNEPVEETLHDSGTYSSNLCENPNKDNVKFREIKIVLERLPANLHVERSSNIDNINNSADGKNISGDIRMRNNKRKLQVRSKIPIRKNIRTRSIRSVNKVNYNYSLNTSNTIPEDQSLEKMQFISQPKNPVNQVERRNYSILNSISSDEDDFIEYMQNSGKKLKTSSDTKVRKIIGRNSHDDKTKLINKNKDRSDEKLSSLNHSSNKSVSKKTNKLIKRKNGLNGIKIRSCDNPVLTGLSQMNGNNVFPSKTNNNATNVSNKYRKTVSFFNFNTDSENDSEKHSYTMTNRNKIDHKNDTVLFQTKIFHTDSESEKSDGYIISNRKAVTQVNNSTRNLRCDHVNEKNFFNHSVTKKCNEEDSNLSNSIIKQMHNVKTRSRSCSKEMKINKQFANEEFNDNIDSLLSDAAAGRYTMNNVTDESSQEKIYLCISSRKSYVNDTSRSKQISNSSTAIQPEDAKSQSVSKLLTFQTKNYYDSDSSES